MRHFYGCLVIVGLLGTAGCTTNSSQSFIFTADLPPNFSYRAIAKYAPAAGETCTVTLDDQPYLGFNREWRTEYKPESRIPIYRTVKGCPLALYRVSLEINAMYGKDYGDFSGDTTAIVIREYLEEQYKGVFNPDGVSTIHGQCQWFFRTVGPERYIIKLLSCKEIDKRGVETNRRPGEAYTLSQLPGKTVKLKIKLAETEKPATRGTWVNFPNGWKRCLGKGLQDHYGFCFGNFKDFSTFKMPDGRKCTIYPNCTDKEVAQ